MRRDHARGSEEPGHLLEEMSGGVIALTDAVRPAESAHRHITTPPPPPPHQPTHEKTIITSHV